MIKPLLDVHTHTIVSGHAYSTLQEMADAARQKGLHILGMAEHGPSIQGACSPMYFRNMHVIPKEINGVQILVGAEINLLDCTGKLDIDESTIDRLMIRIVGIHNACFRRGSVDENTDGLLKVIRNPKIDIISHPADGTAELHLEKIVLEAKEHGILLEVNNSSLNPNRNKEHAWEYNREFLRLCKKYELMVILGSDAHISYDVAKYDLVFKLLEEENFPDALVINDKPDLFRETLIRNRARDK